MARADCRGAVRGWARGTGDDAGRYPRAIGHLTGPCSGVVGHRPHRPKRVAGLGGRSSGGWRQAAGWWRHGAGPMAPPRRTVAAGGYGHLGPEDFAVGRLRKGLGACVQTIGGGAASDDCLAAGMGARGRVVGRGSRCAGASENSRRSGRSCGCSESRGAAAGCYCRAAASCCWLARPTWPDRSDPADIYPRPRLARRRGQA